MWKHVDAQQLFDGWLTRDIITWNALFARYANQGEYKLVFHLFQRTRHEGMHPNGVTLLGVLTACSYTGLLDKAGLYFLAMSKQYGILPTIEHYTCMIDLLARAGQVEAAVAMVERMPFEPDAVSWVAVLGACQSLKNLQVGRQVFEHATVKMEGAYMRCLMGCIYDERNMQ